MPSSTPFYEDMFQRERLLDIVKNFILFSGDTQRPVKILAGYHQYFAVRKAVEKAVTATFIGFTGRCSLRLNGFLSAS